MVGLFVVLLNTYLPFITHGYFFPNSTHGPKCMGQLFLDFAPAINAVGCDYSKIYLHVITGLEEHM